MAAVLDRAPPEVEEYDCTCVGFRKLNLMLMCLRCLEAYSAGLPHVLQGERLEQEMRRVAIRLRMLLNADPLIANLPVEAVLNAAEGN